MVTSNLEYPGETNLKSVADKAASYYEDHKEYADILDENSLAYSAYDVLLEFYQESLVRNIEDATKFALENAAELHDIALIEAHLGGVAINVEQPLTIGEKIEVHKA